MLLLLALVILIVALFGGLAINPLFLLLLFVAVLLVGGDRYGRWP